MVILNGRRQTSGDTLCIQITQDNWTEIINYAIFAINRAPNHALCNRSALYYERGFDPITPIDLIGSLPIKHKDACPKDTMARLKHLEHMRTVIQDKLHEAEKNYIRYYNERHHDEIRIKVGSLVRLNLDHIKLKIFKNRGNKLNPIYYGPFKVIAQPSTVSFTLDLPKDTHIHNTFHVSKLKPATDQTYSSLPHKKVSLPTVDTGEEEYEVERILDHRWDHRHKNWEYLIQWKNWSNLFENRWEPSEHLDGAEILRNEYDRKVGISQPTDHQQSKEGEGSVPTKKKRKRKQK